MGRHSVSAAPSTQAAHPWRATIRTALATGVPAFASAIYVLPQIIQIILDEIGVAGLTLPDEVRLWLLAVAAICTAASAAITRIMAIKKIVELTPRALAPAPSK